MAAILARKLGMTQRFRDDGRVERVTVLEAGPCPVTAIRTRDRDGYDAVQLAFGACKEKVLTKPELGHLKKADASAHRHLAEFRDEAGELTSARRSRLTCSPRATRSRSREPRRARASRGRSSGTTSRVVPSRTALTTSARPGSIGASATPSRVMKGIRGPGHMGSARITQRGRHRRRRVPKQNLLLVRGAVPGAKGGIVEVRTDA